MKTVVCFAAAALLFAGALGACSSDFEPGSRIAKLRLLGLRADRPFAAPGERVSLRALWVDPETRPLSWALATCVNPPGSTVDSCLATLDAPPAQITLDGDSLAIEIPDDILDGLGDDERANASLGVILVACPGTIDGGRTLGVPVVCRDPDGDALPITEFEVGLKRIFVRTSDRNRNPRIDRISWDGEPWPEDEPRTAGACGADGYEIDECAESLRHAITVAAGPAESGVDEHGAPYNEQLIVQAYATDGLFREGVRTADSPEFEWAAQRTHGDDLVRLWFMVRDDRGGMDFVERRVRVR